MKMELLKDPDVRTVVIDEIKRKILTKTLNIIVAVFIISICIIYICVLRDLSLLLLLVPVSAYYFSHKEVVAWQ